jgi:hypothetical protein
MISALSVLAQDREDGGSEILGQLGRIDQALIGHQGQEERARRHAVRGLFLDKAEGLDAEPDFGALPPERGLGVQRVKRRIRVVRIGSEAAQPVGHELVEPVGRDRCDEGDVVEAVRRPDYVDPAGRQHAFDLAEVGPRVDHVLEDIVGDAGIEGLVLERETVRRQERGARERVVPDRVRVWIQPVELTERGQMARGRVGWTGPDFQYPPILGNGGLAKCMELRCPIDPAPIGAVEAGDISLLPGHVTLLS